MKYLRVLGKVGILKGSDDSHCISTSHGIVTTAMYSQRGSVNKNAEQR